MSHSELGLAAAVFHPGTAAAPTFDPAAPARQFNELGRGGNGSIDRLSTSLSSDLLRMAPRSGECGIVSLPISRFQIAVKTRALN